MITPVVTNAVSDFLRSQVNAAGGTIAEVFVMDDHGLIVGASGITSDYWQGDEEKFSQTYAKGAGAMHEERGGVRRIEPGLYRPGVVHDRRPRHRDADRRG